MSPGSVDVIGYTDSVGKSDENVTLSWRREEAVRRFLAERGVEINRFYFIGVGEELSGDDVRPYTRYLRPERSARRDA